MRDFLARQESLPPSLHHPATSSTNDVRGTISRALEVLSQQQQQVGAEYPPRYRLRLASAADVDAISRLVQGLADFEREPDAVHLTTEDYLRDGFGSDIASLFYCLLLDDAAPNIGVRNSVVPYTCGIALCLLGERLHDAGRFLFLEDLFIEESHRGGGAGRWVMTALGAVALSLQCSKMVWQTLHWNTPSLTFYEKLGSQVQDGLETLQYTGQTLVEFADW